MKLKTKSKQSKNKNKRIDFKYRTYFVDVIEFGSYVVVYIWLNIVESSCQWKQYACVCFLSHQMSQDKWFVVIKRTGKNDSLIASIPWKNHLFLLAFNCFMLSIWFSVATNGSNKLQKHYTIIICIIIIIIIMSNEQFYGSLF